MSGFVTVHGVEHNPPVPLVPQNRPVIAGNAQTHPADTEKLREQLLRLILKNEARRRQQASETS